MKTYALALGWWASRGIAHIGVIQYIEENNITISEVAGTSMGAIIGAAFALGVSSEKMRQFIAEINFLKLVDLDMKEALVSGNKIYKKLFELYGDVRIEDTKIPLKIVATDLHSGEKKVFTSGKIIDAVRASISLPSIFKPYEVEEIKYIDGGLRTNLPVRELEWNDIIAVSVVRETYGFETHRRFFSWNIKKWFIGHTLETLKKTIHIIMANNEDLHIELAGKEGKNVILLKPNITEFEYFDFLKYDEIIAKGYESAQKTLKNL